MSDERENYYILLEVEPTVLDWPALEQAIRSKRSRWSDAKAKNPSPRQRRKAEQNLALLPDIERVLKDETLRKAEARQAVERLKKLRQQQLEGLRGDLALLLTGKKYLLQSELEKLIRKYEKENLTEAQIRAEITAEVREVGDDGSSPKVKPLDSTVHKNIEEELASLKCADLYAFLGMSRQAGRKGLLEKADAISAEVSLSAKKTPEISSKQALVGHCKVVFASDEARQSYDLAMAEAGLQRVTEQIDLLGADTIDPQTFQRLVQVGMESGATAPQAEKHIKQTAKKRGKAVEVPSQYAATLRQCGHCGVLNQVQDDNCRKCGEKLIVTCPMSSCGAKTPSTHPRCTACGFPLGDLPEIGRELTRARNRLAVGEAEEACRLLAAFQRDRLPGHPNYPPLQTLLKEAAEAERQLGEAAAQLRQLLRERRMEEAERMLGKLPATARQLPQVEKTKAEVEKAFRQAEQSYQAALAAERQGKFDEAFGHCSAALASVQDHSQVRRLMAKYPPEPPGKLAAKGGRTIRLTWTPSRSPGALEYKVVRREGGPPRTAADGQLVGTTSADRMDDQTAEPGASYHYAVFTVRGGCDSPPAYTGPHMGVADVGELAAKAGDGVVSLSWEAPPRTVEVQVWRAEGRAPQERSGPRLGNVRSGGVTDNAVVNGKTYGYLVSAVYRREDGVLAAAPGLTVLTTPECPPRPVRTLAAQRKGNQVSLSWEPPRRGTVEIYRLAQDPGLPCGEQQDVNQLAARGVKVPALTDHSAKDELRGERQVFYLPVTVAGSVGVVGQGCCVTVIDEVEDLRVTVREPYALLKWRWPPQTKFCRVALRTDQYATGPDDAAAVKDKVFLSVYESKGGCYMPLPTQAHALYITVHAGISVGEEEVFAAGASAGARATLNVRGKVRGTCEVIYEIKCSRSWFSSSGRGELLLSAGDRQVTLPALCLVAKVRTVPLHAQDGKVLRSYEKGLTIRPGEVLRQDFEPAAASPHSLVKLFPADPADAEWLKLVPKKARMEI